MRDKSGQDYGVSRRLFMMGSLATLGSASLLRSDPACLLLTEQEEGPYYIGGETFRQNITEGKPGVPLKLRVALVNAKTCKPLQNASLDIWHCDAVGVYSGFSAIGPGGPGGPGGRFGRAGGGGPDFPPPPPRQSGETGDGPGRPGPGGPPRSRITNADRFLRGAQLTDQRGLTEFTTLYPGWYQGRAIHIHLKVHYGGETTAEAYTGGHVAHTGQLFFPEDLTERISKLQPYAKHLDVHRTTQQEDHVFNEEHGSACLMDLDYVSKGSLTDGLIARVTLAVDPDATPAPVGFDGHGPFGPPPSSDR